MYIRDRSVCWLGYIGERGAYQPRGFRITLGVDGSDGPFFLGSFGLLVQSYGEIVSRELTDPCGVI